MTASDPKLSAATRRAIMDSIVIRNSRAQIAHEKCDYLRELSRLQPGRPQRCFAIIGKSQSGKTTILDSYVKRLNTPEAMKDRAIPALFVSLQANITRRQFAQNILAGFEKHGFNTVMGAGTESELLLRVVKCLATRKVSILFLDEFHHLVHSDNTNVIKGVSEAIKSLLLEGTCPIVVAGLPDATKPFNNNPQLAHRAEPHLELNQLDPDKGDDIELFETFLLDFLDEAERRGAAEGLLDLMADHIPSCIWEVSRGIMGAALNLVKEGVQVAAAEGRSHIMPNDLLVATDYAIRNGVYKGRNPFRHGFQGIRPMDQE